MPKREKSGMIQLRNIVSSGTRNAEGSTSKSTMVPCSTLASALKRLAALDGAAYQELSDRSIEPLEQPNEPVRPQKHWEDQFRGGRSKMKNVLCWCGRQSLEIFYAIKAVIIIAVCGVIFCAAIMTLVNYLTVILGRWRF